MHLLKKGLQTPFEKWHEFQNFHLASSSPSTARDLSAGGMSTSSLARTVAKQSNGFPPITKDFFQTSPEGLEAHMGTAFLVERGKVFFKVYMGQKWL